METNNNNLDGAATTGSSKGNLIVYQSEGGRIQVDVRLEQETVWLSQEHMARLFGKSKQTISEHIRNIFHEGELQEKVVVRKFLTTTPHGAMEGKTQSREVTFYNYMNQARLSAISWRQSRHEKTKIRKKEKTWGCLIERTRLPFFLFA
jgi:hypothetical protein